MCVCVCVCAHDICPHACQYPPTHTLVHAHTLSLSLYLSPPPLHLLSLSPPPQAYANLRMEYSTFDSATTQFSMKHVSTLLASKDETEIKTLAKYITEAMSVRKKKTNEING